MSYENKNLDYFISILDSSYFTAEWSIPENIDEEKTLITIHDKILKYIDFATFLEDNQKRGSSVPINQLVYDLYKKFIDYNTLEVYKHNLEKENSDYRYVIKEYREGLLLFNLMQEKIWTVKESDSTQLKSFFDNNKDKYTGFEEDRGKIIGDFQQSRESIWLNNLKLKHKVNLNKKAIKRLRNKYN